jgi:hypothetical protein
MLQFEASVTDDAISVNCDHNMFIIQATDNVFGLKTFSNKYIFCHCTYCGTLFQPFSPGLLFTKLLTNLLRKIFLMGCLIDKADGLF